LASKAPVYNRRYLLVGAVAPNPAAPGFTVLKNEKLKLALRAEDVYSVFGICDMIEEIAGL
jgi:hypothetical protein